MKLVPSLKPITQPQLQELKKSRESAAHLLKQFNIKGWPRVITIDSAHFLAL